MLMDGKVHTSLQAADLLEFALLLVVFRNCWGYGAASLRIVSDRYLRYGRIVRR